MEEKLIELVKKHKLLYDKTNKHYKNVDIREKIWKSMGEELNLDSESVKKRWKTLRDRYVREKRSMKMPSGSGCSVKKEYKFHSHLQFLDDCALNASTLGNYSLSETNDCELLDSLTFEGISPSPFLGSSPPKSSSSSPESFPPRRPSSSSSESFPPRPPSSSSPEPSSPSQFVNNALKMNAGNKRKIKALRSEVLINNVSKEMTKLVELASDCLKDKKMTAVRAFFESVIQQIEENNLSFERFAYLQKVILSAVHVEISQQKKENNK